MFFFILFPKNNLDALTNAGDGFMLESGIFALCILTNQHDVDVLEMSVIIKMSLFKNPISQTAKVNKIRKRKYA